MMSDEIKLGKSGVMVASMFELMLNNTGHEHQSSSVRAVARIMVQDIVDEAKEQIRKENER